MAPGAEIERGREGEREQGWRDVGGGHEPGDAGRLESWKRQGKGFFPRDSRRSSPDTLILGFLGSKL